MTDVSPEVHFDFWDNLTTVTRVVGSRHYIAVAGRELSLSFCNNCGSAFCKKEPPVCANCGVEQTL